MPRFVVQKHYATSHHFDLRLERGGVLASWAVPKGMPEDTKKNRLAMRVDDHDLSHLDVVAVSTLGQLLSVLVRLLAAALFALARFVTKSYYEGVPSITRASFALLITSGLTVVPAGATIPPRAPGTGALVGILLLGLGSTACGLYSYFTLIDEVGAGRAALVTYLGPGFSLLMAALLLGERITPASVVGLALILGGVVIASRGSRPTTIPAAVPCCEGLATGHPRTGEGNRP